MGEVGGTIRPWAVCSIEGASPNVLITNHASEHRRISANKVCQCGTSTATSVIRGSITSSIWYSKTSLDVCDN